MLKTGYITQPYKTFIHAIMRNFEILDIPGDAGIRVRGRELEDIFINAAYGMSELTTDTSYIHETESRDIHLHSDSHEGLLILWLNELVFLFDAYGFVGKRITINLHKKTLAAKIWGGIFDPDTNEKRLLIKAATYHRLSLKKNGNWEATILFDI